MRIRIVCPAPRGSLSGNRVSAQRWAAILESLGHDVQISTYLEGPCDLLVALHAKRSASAVYRYSSAYPGKPVVVALTGTDLYRDIQRSVPAQRALERATRLLALQPLAAEELPEHLRGKLRIIYQSVEQTAGAARPPSRTFQVCVVGHLRHVKDPFRAALSVRKLPGESRIRIVHAGSAMTRAMERRARAEEERNPRYCWRGGIPRLKTRRLIASSHALVLSSRMEGGANVISEAVVDGTPIIASRIPGSVGLLGEDYPGFYETGNTEELRGLLLRAETDAAFYQDLRARCARLAPLFDPQRERFAWDALLAEL